MPQVQGFGSNDSTSRFRTQDKNATCNWWKMPRNCISGHAERYACFQTQEEVNCQRSHRMRMDAKWTLPELSRMKQNMPQAFHLFNNLTTKYLRYSRSWPFSRAILRQKKPWHPDPVRQCVAQHPWAAEALHRNFSCISEAKTLELKILNPSQTSARSLQKSRSGIYQQILAVDKSFQLLLISPSCMLISLPKPLPHIRTKFLLAIHIHYMHNSYNPCYNTWGPAPWQGSCTTRRHSATLLRSFFLKKTPYGDKTVIRKPPGQMSYTIFIIIVTICDII